METVPEISPQELASALKERAGTVRLVDVRTPEEHALVALPGSILLPMSEIRQRLEEEVQRLRGARVVVYCHHGVRSLRGAAVLRAEGVDAFSLAGGIDRYAAEVDRTLTRY